MSDYKPITGELRERIGQSEHIIPLSGESQYMQVRINLAWLVEKLDAIDAIHARLEKENERLRRELRGRPTVTRLKRENAELKAEMYRMLGEQEEHRRSIGEATVTVTPTLDWSGVARELRAIADTLAGDAE